VGGISHKETVTPTQLDSARVQLQSTGPTRSGNFISIQSFLNRLIFFAYCFWNRLAIVLRARFHRNLMEAFKNSFNDVGGGGIFVIEK